MSTESRRRYTAGQITALLSVDSWLSSCSSMLMPLPLFGALFLPFLFWMLSVRVGVWPSLCCATWAVAVLVLPFLSSFLQKRFWVRVLRARDERLKSIADLLSTIRVVKMYAWEDALRENVLRSRNVELKWLFRVNVLDALLDCIYSSTSAVLMIILFSTLHLLEPDVVLTPALTFSCVSLLYLTDLPMNSGAQALRMFSQAGSLAQLIDINLSVDPGALIGVVGFVGCGKSSLLAAILGDMHQIKGTVTCAGANFSGGQKQRISIARAVYSKSDVFLLDDPLSSLDPVVASRLFREVISSDGLLRNKTRIMVCNQGNYLKEMDKLVLVHGKRIRVYDTLEDLISDPESPQNFREVLEQDAAQRGDKSR
ncbi:hypothetical protein MTO96_041616 [Rhipicephalus appendiculatus]